MGTRQRIEGGTTKEVSIFPASFAQERLWVLSRLLPASPLYNIPFTVPLDGPLDHSALEQSFVDVLARHDSLRTTFTEFEGEPIQVVAPLDTFQLPVLDLRDLPDQAAGAEAERCAAGAAQRPFDLAHGPLIRAALVRQPRDIDFLVVTVHHIVFDGWSLQIFVRELTEAYDARRRDRVSELPMPRLQYSDFAVWQRRRLRGGFLEDHLTYWRAQLAGAPPLINLPADRQRPVVQSFRGGLSQIMLPARLGEDLRAIAQQESATLFMVFLAAFDILLFRYSGQDDILVGSPVSNRTHPDLEGVIGLFVNTVVLRADLSGNPTFRELLGRIRETVLGALRHQELPFERLVSELNPERQLSHNPLFQVMFSVDEVAGDLGIEASEDPSELAPQSEDGVSKFDLTLVVQGSNGELSATIEYACDLFESGTIARMLDHLRTLLDGVAAFPDRPLSELSLMGPAERQLFSAEWNNTTADFPRESCIHELFEEQAARTPHATALLFDGTSTTYRELNERATHLGRRLRSLGVGPETLVGLLMERSAEMGVGMLAILKAGGAYVPLDPGYPQQRIAFMLEDCRAPVIVTEKRLAGLLPAGPYRVLCLDEADTEAPRGGIDLQGNRASASNLAYVIYTSGSTGQPKGVMIPHRAVLRLVCNTDYIRLTSDDRVAQASHICFDAATFEIWGALLHGATLVGIPHVVLLSPHSLGRTLREQGVTTMFVTTALFNQVVAQDSRTFTCLRHLLFGGDAADARAVRKLLAVAGSTRVIHVYGPTEATTFATWHEVRHVGEGATSVTIGRPIANTSVYILDRDLQPVPIGVPGELCIGGDGVARGYLERQELTQEKFVKDPFASDPSWRLYRTGDQARYLTDGNIEFLGRLDNQVKVRGFRIELGEVEAALCRHPAIRECAVVARRGESGEARLVAYLVGAPEAPSTGEVRSFLSARLPDYMIPAAFVPMPSLPQTPSGKLDRRALPAPEPTRPHLDRPFVAPTTPTERTLAELWGDVLGVDQVGIHDNFFELGGDSILAIRVLARANAAGLRLTPRQLFQAQSISDLAAVAGFAADFDIEPEVATGPIPLTPIQRWFFERDLPDPHHFGSAVTIPLNGDQDAESWVRAVADVVTRHDALRLRFVHTEQGWTQSLAHGPHKTPFSRVDLTRVPESERQAATRSTTEHIERGFDLARGPLFQVALLDFGSEHPKHLVVAAHHLIIDNVSWVVLIDDLLLAYDQLSQGGPSTLPRKTLSFSGWANRLERAARERLFEGEESYWLTAHAGVVQLPVDFARSADDNTVASAQVLTMCLGRDDTSALIHEAPKAYHLQVKDVLLAALAVAIRRWTGSPSVVVDLETHGREPFVDGLDVSRTVGWFTALFPLRLDLAGLEDSREILASVKEQIRKVPNGGIGYGTLRYLGADGARWTDVCSSDICLNYHGHFIHGGEDQLQLDPDQASSALEGLSQNKRGRRSHLIEINAGIADGALSVEWTYSAHVHRLATIDALATSFQQGLCGLIAHCVGVDRRRFTPSDFPLAQLEQEGLDRVIEEHGDVEDLYPLAPMQAGMLFHALYAPESGEYVVSHVLPIDHALDVDAFLAAWSTVIGRHPALRGSCAWDGLDEPLQVVHWNLEPQWTHHDLRGVPAAESDRRFAALLDDARRQGFDLTRPPLMRFSLLRTGDDSHVLIWCFHHILLDGWSFSLVLKEVFLVYEALLEARPLQLGPVRPPREFIAWLGRQDRSAAEAFWKQALEAFAAPTPIVAAAGRILPSREWGYRERQIRLSAQFTRLLQDFARTHQLTVNTVVQGAWALLLTRYTDESDVVFGATVSGRPVGLPGVESMVGLFINTLPVRVRVDGDSTVRSWLALLQRNQAEARQYEYYPLSRIQALSAVPSGQPLFESIVVFENVDEAKSSPHDDLQSDHAPPQSEWTNYPLTLSSSPEPELPLVLIYSAGLFEGETIARMLEHLRTVIEGMVSGSDRRLFELPLMAPAESRRLVSEWNETTADFPRESCIHGLFEDQVRRTPDATAVVCERDTLSYAELNARADRLAHQLHSLGVRPDTIVGLLTERSPDMIVGVLGILKAGGAYVPLDPSLPKHRLGFILEDCRAPVVVVQEHLTGILPAGEHRVLAVDRVTAESSVADAAPPHLATASNLAYVIYTSGSTGKPKGVMIEHRSLVNFTQMAKARYGLRSDDRVLQFASICFDTAAEEIYPCLTLGATLVLRSAAMAESIEGLIAGCRNWNISVLDLPTSFWHQLSWHLAWKGASLPHSVRTVIVGGEKLLPERLKDWHKAVRGSIVLMHGYGPTEATVAMTVAELTPVNLSNHDPSCVSIGRPIGNTAAYVLDSALRPMPVGVTGELYLGGECLARGYLNRPELTAERFIHSPFVARDGARLYRTGDKARFLPDGQIECLGRADDQVKIRGYRVELGEIETVLARHASIKAAAVVARQDVPGLTSLVAYVVPRNGETAPESELRQFLEGELPSYMVPSVFVGLAALPLTPTGKVDRRALPPPDRDGQAESSYVAPRTREEELLTGIWADVLGRERVGIRDNFFDLGGDSILSLQIISRANAAGLRFTPKQLFERQTVEALALAEGLAGGPAQTEQGEVTGMVPLTPIQHWFFEQDSQFRKVFTQSMSLEVREYRDAALWRQVIDQVLRHHDALRHRFRRTSSGWSQIATAIDDTVPFEFRDFSNLRDEQQEAAIAALAVGIVDAVSYVSGPLIFAVLVDLGVANGARLFVAVHHLVIDGVSWRILIDDLRLAYEQLARGEVVRLPRKTTSFRHWAGRLAERALVPELKEELPYWFDQGTLACPSIPVDGPLTSAPASRSVITVSLDRQETRRLLQDVSRVFHTQVNDALLTGIMLAVHGWTGARRLRVELEGHGREPFDGEIDLSRTVGWFTSVFPVVLELVDTAEPEAALHAIQDQLSRVPNRGIGYGLWRYLAGESETLDKLAAHPQPEVAFNYLGQFDVPPAQFFDLIGAIAGEAPLSHPEASHATHDGVRQEGGAYAQRCLLEVNAGVFDGELWIGWSYSEASHRRETVSRLAERYRQALCNLIECSASTAPRRLTPASFPLARIDHVSLDRISASTGEVEDIYPLSPMQQGILFQIHLAPEASEYVVPFTLPMYGEIDSKALKRAWQSVLDRHTVLRSRFEWEGLDEPVQIVQRSVDLPWGEDDWTSDSPPERSRRLEGFVDRERRRGVDLTRAPLMRLRLVRLDRQTHVLVWTCHHLLLDGWSVPLVMSEVSALYDAIRAHRAIELPPARPFRDYIAWLRSQNLVAAEEYWRRMLAGFDAPTPLPPEPDPPAAYAEGSAEEGIVLGEAETEQLAALARRNKLTLNTLVQAAWALLLSRHSGESDVIFGATVSGRPASLEGVESMVGMFINTLPVRVRVDRHAPLASWLQEIQAGNIEAMQHEHTPLVDIQRWAGVRRGQALFDTLVVFANYPLKGFADDGVSDESSVAEDDILPEPSEWTNFTLALMVLGGDQLSLQIVYKRRKYQVDTVRRLLGHLATLLEGFVTDVARPVSAVPMLSSAETDQVLVHWNQTARTFPSDSQIHHLFEDVASRCSDVLAVTAGSEALTYRELNERANRLAHHLMSLGIGPGDLVALCMDRSLEMTVCLLGILKAGAAYVPLDPSYPGARLAIMLEDSRASLVVMRQRFRKRITRAPEHCRFLHLEEMDEALARSSRENPNRVGTSGDLAYVLYTSGSTGRPKGVPMTHRSLVNLIYWQVDNSCLRPGTRTVQSAPLSFDVSFQEMFSTWCSGGTLVIMPDETRMDSAAVLSFLSRESIERWFVPFVALHAVAESARASGSVPPALREVLCAGEQLRISPAVRSLFRRMGRCALHNQYGPTETHVVTEFALTGDPQNWPILPPIGRPIANTRIHILDPDLQPVPVGVSGELCIGGAGVARGYLERPELGREKFISDPFVTDCEARLYRTGDKARYLADGNIEFLGRMDQQVKVRGFRIELGEVEATLAQHPAVRECAVVARQEDSGEIRLVAYLVDGPEAPSVGDLRSFLEKLLPEYMIPSAFVLVESLPRTPSGKLDRRALPAPSSARPDIDGPLVVPRSPTEEALAEIWAEVLGLDHIGIHDNFFELGGHSLVAMRITSRIRQRFGSETSLRLLYENPDVATLARTLAGVAPTPSQGPELTPLSRDEYRAQVSSNGAIEIPIALRKRLAGLGDFEAGDRASHGRDDAAGRERMGGLRTERGSRRQVIELDRSQDAGR